MTKATNEDCAKVGKINAALRIEMANLLQESRNGAAKAIEDYLATAPFESRLRFHRLLTNA